MAGGPKRFEIMKTHVTVAFAASFLLGILLLTAPGARAQSAEQLNVRMTQMEDQMRQLYGQVEQLSYQMHQLQDQIARLNPSGKIGDAGPIPEAPTQKPKKTAAIPQPTSKGIEQIGDAGVPQDQAPDQIATVIDQNGTEEQIGTQKAPGPKVLGTLPGTTFEGQVLVPQMGQDNAQVQTGGNQIETVSLGNQTGDNADALYERSYESLLRRQFADAETGFRSFLEKNPEHSLAGNAQYWLGETYYAQGDYRQAAQSFLTGYKQYPKSRKAPDSLLKLALSLTRLGQKEQACAAFGQVANQFPKAAETRKRAQSEAQHAGC